MSIDMTSCCLKCKAAAHLGQDMGGLQTFGYGSSDIKGREMSAQFLLAHLDCGAGNLIVVRTDDIPQSCKVLSDTELASHLKSKSFE